LLYLGDNCIVFENFTASIGDLMMANCVYSYIVARNVNISPSLSEIKKDGKNME
jgi:hypothetical protein